MGEDGTTGWIGGYVAAGYGSRHFVAVSVSGSVEIQRDTHVGLQSGENFLSMTLWDLLCSV